MNQEQLNEKITNLERATEVINEQIPKLREAYQTMNSIENDIHKGLSEIFPTLQNEDSDEVLYWLGLKVLPRSIFEDMEEDDNITTIPDEFPSIDKLLSVVNKHIPNAIAEMRATQRALSNEKESINEQEE